jgi:hypothetical protein
MAILFLQAIPPGINGKKVEIRFCAQVARLKRARTLYESSGLAARQYIKLFNVFVNGINSMDIHAVTVSSISCL